MASKFEKMWRDAEQRVRNYERVADRAGDMAILRAALAVINRNDLASEFVEELSKPKPVDAPAES